jgi:hypothetical protein
MSQPDLTLYQAERAKNSVRPHAEWARQTEAEFAK